MDNENLNVTENVTEDIKTVKPKTNTKTNKKGSTTTKRTTAKKVKQKLRLKDDVILNVESLIPGGLIYINHNTGDEVIWDNKGDIRQISVANIREMKARQKKFFTDNWIRILSIEDEGYEGYTVEDIYDSLTLNNYYANSRVNIKDLILHHSDKIQEYINKMGDTFKTQVIITANDMILDGSLDSFKLIRKLEKILETDLMDIDD
ncbi:hypothetical protein [uncultured Thomasclavelia sp.]|uniref:hypothetical protein n=1 Tax=uncultured Thomasclavelia sp. TaxID=3025759 RepID=UPI00261CAAAE|nr:hypothetical protein [uncultured Thomasclavelia sp.]